MRVLLTDTVLSNTGDAGILHGLMLALGQGGLPRPEFVHCEHLEVHTKLYPDLPLRTCLQEAMRRDPPRFFWRYRIGSRARLGVLLPKILSGMEREALKDYTKVDLVISNGGAFLTDTYNIRPRLQGYDVAHALGRPCAILGQTIGPFRSAAVAEELGKRLRRMLLVAVRDQKSFELACKLVADKSRVVRCMDFAFSLDPIESSPGDSVCHESDRGPKVVVSLRRWTYPDHDDPEAEHVQYVSRMAELVTRLVSRLHCRVLLMSTCQGIAQYSFQDEQVADEVMALLDDTVRKHVEVDRGQQTVERFMRRVSDANVLIGTRMHACILAMVQGVPSINIEYEFKSRELYRELEMSEFCHPIDKFSPDMILKDVQTILASSTAIRNRLKQKIESFRNINVAAVERLSEALGRQAG